MSNRKQRREAGVEAIGPVQKLNKAELYAIRTAHQQVQQAQATLNQVVAIFHDIQRSVGMDPFINYRVEDDGTVIPESTAMLVGTPDPNG